MDFRSDEDGVSSMRGQRVRDAAEQSRAQNTAAPLAAHDQTGREFVCGIQDGPCNTFEGLSRDR